MLKSSLANSKIFWLFTLGSLKLDKNGAPGQSYYYYQPGTKGKNLQIMLNLRKRMKRNYESEIESGISLTYKHFWLSVHNLNYTLDNISLLLLWKHWHAKNSPTGIESGNGKWNIRNSFNRFRGDKQISQSTCLDIRLPPSLRFASCSMQWKSHFSQELLLNILWQSL